MKLLAALLHGDDPPPGPRGLGQAMAQMGLMAGVLDTAWTAMRKLGGDKPGCQCVFVAPEFWFSNRFTETISDVDQNGKFYNEYIKKWIVDAIETTSKNYPNVLIVPGTVLWFMKRKVGSVHVEKVKKRYEDLARYHDATYKNVEASFTSQYGQKTMTDLKQGQLSRPTYTHHGPPSQHNMSPAELLDTGDYVIGANTAYIAKDGVVLKYHKIGNSEETKMTARPIVFMPGNIVGQFYVGGVRYGLEICMDHWLGIQKNSNAPAPDVQIITSAQTNDQQFHQTGKGAIVHASNRGPEGIKIEGRHESVGYSGAAFANKVSHERLQTYDNKLALDLVAYNLDGVGMGAMPGDTLKPLEPQQDLSGTFGLRVDLPRIR